LRGWAFDPALRVPENEIARAWSRFFAGLAFPAAPAFNVTFFSRCGAYGDSTRLLAAALYLGVFEVDEVEAFRARDFLVVVICYSA
jgi:hypothetical protein